MDDFNFGNAETLSTAPMDELRTLARNIVTNMVKGVDWSDFKQMAEFVTADEADADIVVYLMSNAKIEVTT